MIIRDCILNYPKCDAYHQFLHLRCPVCANEDITEGQQTYWLPDANSKYAGLSAEPYSCSCGWSGSGSDALVHVSATESDQEQSEERLAEYIATFDPNDRPTVSPLRSGLPPVPP